MQSSCLLVLGALTFLQQPVPGRSDKISEEGLKDLYILGLFPMRGQWPEGPGYSQAVLMGLEDINKRQDILPGYRLNLVWNDTQVGPFNTRWLSEEHV